MYIVIQHWPKSGEENILVDDKGEVIIHSTLEEAEKAIDAELDVFVDQLIISMSEDSED